MPRGNVREELIVLDDRGMSAPLVARRFRDVGSEAVGDERR